MPRAPRVVVVGFDAMSTPIILDMVRDGRLPAFAAMLDSSAWAPTLTPPGLLVGGVWPSIATGSWPSRHGFYADKQITSGTYEAPPSGPWMVQAPRLWETLSAAGKRCAVVDAPLTTTLDEFNGIQLVQWGSHDAFVPTGSCPPEIVREVLDLVGEYPVQPKCDAFAGDLPGLRAALLAGVDARSRLTAHVFEKEPWDFFISVFSESHCAGHHFWRFHDEADDSPLGDPLLEVYERLDGALADLVAMVPDDALQMIVLSHGIGSHHDGAHLLWSILQRLDDADARRELLIQRERVIRRMGRRTRSARHGVPLDSGRRFFFTPNNDLFGGVRINLKGREPRGRVAPGAEYERVVAQLSADLLELENVETGGPVVDEVLRADELYDGPLSHTLPDLLVGWHRTDPIRRVHSTKLGTVVGERRGHRSGDHRPGGLVAFRGPGIVPGALTDPVPVVDLAPTLAAWLGVELADVDGRPIPAIAVASVRPA